MLVGDPIPEIASIKTVLDQSFGVKILGVLKFFLGLKAAHFSKGISYAKDNIALICLEMLVFLAANQLQLP